MSTVGSGSQNAIEVGKIIQPEHVKNLLQVLNGESTDGVIFKGSVEITGPSSSFNVAPVSNLSKVIASGDISGSGNFQLSGDSKQGGSQIVLGSGSYGGPLKVTGDISGSNISGSGRITGQNITTPGAITGSYLSASLEIYTGKLSASQEVYTRGVTIDSIGPIIKTTSSINILQTVVTESLNSGVGFIFGGPQVRYYGFTGGGIVRYGFSNSTLFSTSSLDSGSYVTALPSFSLAPSMFLASGSDPYFIKYASTTSSQAFTVRSDGAIGIGTWTPREKLDVRGSVVIQETTKASGSILKVEAAGGTLFDIQAGVSSSIHTFTNVSGIPIMEVGQNPLASGYVAVTGTGAGITPSLSSSFNLISASMAVSFKSGSNNTLTVNDFLFVGSGTLTLPSASQAPSRMYMVRAQGADLTVTPVGGNTVNFIPSENIKLGEGRILISDGINNWYTW